MTQYKAEFPFNVLFPPVTPKNVLAEWLAVKKLPQFHTAGMYDHNCSYFVNISYSPSYEAYYRTLTTIRNFYIIDKTSTHSVWTLRSSIVLS